MKAGINYEICDQTWDKGETQGSHSAERMSFAQADTLQYYLDGQNNIVSAKIQEAPWMSR